MQPDRPLEYTVLLLDEVEGPGLRAQLRAAMVSTRGTTKEMTCRWGSRLGFPVDIPGVGVGRADHLFGEHARGTEEMAFRWGWGLDRADHLFGSALHSGRGLRLGRAPAAARRRPLLRGAASRRAGVTAISVAPPPCVP